MDSAGEGGKDGRREHQSASGFPFSIQKMTSMLLVKLRWHTCEIISHCVRVRLLKRFRCSDFEIRRLSFHLTPWGSGYMRGICYKPLAIWIVLLTSDSCYTHTHTHTHGRTHRFKQKAFPCSKCFGNIWCFCVWHMCALMSECMCVNAPHRPSRSHKTGSITESQFFWPPPFTLSHYFTLFISAPPVSRKDPWDCIALSPVNTHTLHAHTLPL